MGRSADAWLAFVAVEFPTRDGGPVIFGTRPGQTGVDPDLEGGFIVLGVETALQDLGILAA